MASRPVSFSLESLLVSVFSPMLTRCLIVRRVYGRDRVAPLLCFFFFLLCVLGVMATATFRSWSCVVFFRYSAHGDLWGFYYSK